MQRLLNKRHLAYNLDLFINNLPVVSNKLINDSDKSSSWHNSKLIYHFYLLLIKSGGILTMISKNRFFFPVKLQEISTNLKLCVKNLPSISTLTYKLFKFNSRAQNLCVAPAV